MTWSTLLAMSAQAQISKDGQRLVNRTPKSAKYTIWATHKSRSCLVYLSIAPCYATSVAQYRVLIDLQCCIIIIKLIALTIGQHLRKVQSCGSCINVRSKRGKSVEKTGLRGTPLVASEFPQVAATRSYTFRNAPDQLILNTLMCS